MIFVSALEAFQTASIGMPAGFAAGDLLLYNAAWNDTPSGGLVAPAGWTLRGIDTQASHPKHLLAHKIATGSETTVTVPATGGGAPGDATIAAYRATGSTILASTGNWAEATGSAGVLNLPALTIPGSSFVIAAFAVQRLVLGQTLSAGGGGGWTLNDSNQGSGNYGFLWEQTPTRVAGPVTGTMQYTGVAPLFWGQAIAVDGGGNRLSMLV